MSATSSSLDASSKRWLIAFALAAVVTIVVLAHSFFSALVPPKKVVSKPQQSSPAMAVDTSASGQSAWESAWQNRSTGYTPNIPPTPPSECHTTNTWVAPPNWEGMVHMQAEYLRKKNAESKAPSDVKQMTLERIDEMEKNGLMDE